MNKPYTYIITHNNTGEFYIGSRSANRSPASTDLWNTYFTSSKLINERIKSEGTDCFTAQVIDEFETPEEAFVAEQALISERISNPLCLNKTYQLNSKQVFLTTGTKRNHSAETRRKISESSKGRKWSGHNNQLATLKKHAFVKGDTPWNKGKTYNKSKPVNCITCPHCNKSISGENNFSRWHGDNCKLNPNRKVDTHSKFSATIKGKPKPKYPCNKCGKMIGGQGNLVKHQSSCQGLKD